MPYKIAEDRRRYDRERKRRIRAAARAAAGPTSLAPVEREPEGVTAVQGLQGLLAEAVARVRRDPQARDIDKGREIGRLVATALRLMETRDLAARLEALEGIVRLPRAL